MSKIPSQKKIDLLLELYRSKRFDELEILANNLTKEFPKHPSGWKVLGVVLKQKGKISESLIVGKKVIELNPDDAEAYFNVGNTLRQQKKLTEALIYYNKSIKLNSKYALAYNNLATTLRELGRSEEAIGIYKKLILLIPSYAEAYNNLGVAFRDLNILEEAKKSYEKAIELRPTYAAAYNNLGITLNALKKFEESVKNFKKAIDLNPAYAEAYNNLGVVLREIQRLDESEQNFKKAIELKPKYAEAFYNLGETYRHKGNLDISYSMYKKATELKPAYAEAYNNLGIVLRELGRLDESEQSYKKAIQLKSNYADAYNNLSFTLLQKYKFEEAFKLSEWRWYTEDETQGMLSSNKPLWNGEINSTVFVWNEQGIGDEIMFCSILPELSSLSKKIIINCDKRLIPLFERSLPKNVFYESKRKKINEKEYDYHIPMGSLRRFFRKNLKSFEKSSKGYLKADLKKTSYFKEKLQDNNSKFIGISWGSKSKLQMSSFKSINLKALATKLHKPNIKLINLQYGDVSEEISELKKNYNIQILDFEELNKTNDIDGLASLICSCDLIVSIDNFLVQLSGSLGIDTRILLPLSMDSRWGHRGKDSYLYNSVSLYRQDKLNNWISVLNQLDEDMSHKF